MKKALFSGVLSFLAGGLYALCYPSEFSEGYFAILFISLSIFLWKLETSENIKQASLVIISYNLGLNLVGFYWIPQTLREFGNLPYFISIFLGLFFSIILQPHWWPYLLWRSFRPSWKWNSQTGILISAFILTLLERFTPQQFPIYVGSPWLHLAPYLGLTPFMGVVVFSFFTYWICLEIVFQIISRKIRPFVWITFSLFVALNVVFTLKNSTPATSLKVRFVQANIGNFLKISSEYGDVNSYQSVRNRYYNLSVLENGFNPQLIIWPETAYPDTFFGINTQPNKIFENITEKTNADLLIGGYDQNTSKPLNEVIETIYNSSILIEKNKVKSSYHKNILIPFGETLPFGPLNRQIVSVVPAVSLFARGIGTPLMELSNGLRFITPICYEILESNYMRDLLNQWKNNHFIVNHTNDSWYGATAEPYQHLFLSKWRALEFQLPVLRSTNTGITSVIYPDGSESKRLGINEENVLDLTVDIPFAQNTVYQIYGMLPLILLFASLLIITWLLEKNGNRP
jgi:apolipoprotein N-acyltransferase